VHTDLLALGKIPDPFVADNELKVMWVAETDWEYRRSFSVDVEILAQENSHLACDGLDTIENVYLNGKYLELKGFVKVEPEPGETKTVSIALDFRAFAYYHPEYRQWITEDGDFDILIGASAMDNHDALTVRLESTLRLPCVLDRESSLREWLADPRGNAILGPFYSEIETQSRKAFGGGEDNGSAIGMDIMDMLNDMPLISVLMF
jgi:hypothetical protein